MFVVRYLFVFVVRYLFVFVVCYLFVFVVCYLFVFVVRYLFVFVVRYLFVFVVCYLFVFACVFCCPTSLEYIYLFIIYLFITPEFPPVFVTSTLVHPFSFLCCVLLVFALCLVYRMFQCLWIVHFGYR